jgi:hypothetical protein
VASPHSGECGYGRSIGSYVVLGVWLGLGLLSKYNCAVFEAALLLAALASRPYRACVADRRILLSLAIAVLLALPHYRWVLEHRDTVWAILSAKTEPARCSLAGMARGLKNLSLNVGLVLLPLVGGLAVIFRLRPGEILRPSAVAGGSAGLRLLGRFFVAALLLLMLKPLLGGGSRFHERWLQPWLVLFPVYCFGRLDWRDLTPGRLRLYAGVLLVLALAVTAVLGLKVLVGSRDDGVYPLQMSLGGAARQLKEEGFDGATLVTSDRVIGGNLRLLFPRARVLCAGHPGYRPPPVQSAAFGERRCFAVWHSNLGPLLPPTLAEFASRSLSRPVSPAGAVRFATVPAVLPGRRCNRFGYLRLTWH